MKDPIAEFMIFMGGSHLAWRLERDRASTDKILVRLNHKEVQSKMCLKGKKSKKERRRVGKCRKKDSKRGICLRGE